MEMEALTLNNNNNEKEKDIQEIKFLKEDFNAKINNENYKIKIGTLKEFLVIKIFSLISTNNHYLSYFTYEQLINISKSMRYFDNINDIVSFMKEKGIKNELFLKKQNNNIELNLKILSPNGKEDDILLEINPHEISDKEMIFNLVQKVEKLENEVSLLKEKINKSEKDVLYLFEEIKLLKSQKTRNDENDNDKTSIDSNITNINEIEFIINRLKQSPVIENKNIHFQLLYRGTRDGDDSIKLHKICDGKKNVIFFMKSEQGNIYGGFSNIGWETKQNWVYPIDDNAFLFSVNKKKIFNAKEGKNKICWINSIDYGLCFCCSLVFYNKFLTIKNFNVNNRISQNFENCSINDLNGGVLECKLSELEVFKII